MGRFNRLRDVRINVLAPFAKFQRMLVGPLDIRRGYMQPPGYIRGAL